jgi:hypothetical protein
MSKDWVDGGLVLALLLGFGLSGWFEGDGATQWIALAMFAGGTFSLALLAAWFQKPIGGDGEAPP